MSYVVLDLEWNQAMSSQSSIYNHLPIHLRGEIIQIGAVKLTDDLRPGEEFQLDVKPVYFRRIHYKVKKLTGFDKERLEQGIGFKQAFKLLREWCGEDCTFLTWGYDDQGIMEQNIIIHDLDWDWIKQWINLQLIYNVQTGGDKNQKALKTAMENFEIPQTRVAHDALGDAYNTALVCTKLDLLSGIEHYDEAASLLAARTAPQSSSDDNSNALEHRSFHGFASRAEAIADPTVTEIKCPECNSSLKISKWVDQGDRRYMSIGSCKKHGKYLIRLKFRHLDSGTWSVNRIIYKADDDMVSFYEAKAVKSKKRSRKHRKKIILKPKTDKTAHESK